MGIGDIGNGVGYLYIADPSGNIKSSLKNSPENALRLFVDGLTSPPPSGERLAVGSVKVNVGGGTITNTTVNGVGIMGATAATGATPQLIATDLASKINLATSIPDYTSIAVGDTAYIFPLAGTGSTPNGFVVATTVTAPTTTTTSNMANGSSTTGVFDPTLGRQFYINANYGGTALSGDLTNAVDITANVAGRNFVNALYSKTATIASDQLTIERASSIVVAYIDTEGAAPTDNLNTIVPVGYNDGDILIIRGVNSGRVTTIISGTGNIFLVSATNFVTGDNTVNIALQYRSGIGFHEIFRSFANVFSGTTNTIVKYTGATTIGNGTWAFSGNDIYPVTDGSNIGLTGTNRVGTIFLASTLDYAANLLFKEAGTERARFQNGILGIGTTSPNTSSILDLTSTTGALLFPRMTTAQKNALVAVNGMEVYDTTLNLFQKYENGVWVGGGASGSGTANKLTKWSTSVVLGDAVAADDGTNTGFGITSSLAARIHIKGAGSTSATKAFQIDSSTVSNLMYVQDDGQIFMGSAVASVTANTYLVNITGSNTAAGGGGTFLTGLNVIPTNSGSFALGIAGINVVATVNNAVALPATLSLFKGIAVQLTSGASQVGAIGDAINIDILAPTWAGTKPGTHYGLLVRNLGVAGTTTSEAIHILAQSGSTNNFGIVCEPTLNRFGSATAPTATVDITGTFKVSSTTTLGATEIHTGVTTSSGPGAVGVTGRIHEITTTAAGNALTLANGTDGQRLSVVYVAEAAGADTAILTPTTLAGAATIITFNALGDSVELLYKTTGGWYVVGVNGAVIS